MIKLLVSAVLAVAVVACVPAPKKAYAPEEVKQLDDIHEVMRVNAATMDPLFSLEDETAFDAATFARFSEASTTIQATGASLQKASIAGKFPPGFMTHAKSLEAGAAKLGAAAGASDAAGSAAAIGSIHQTCRDCHAEMR